MLAQKFLVLSFYHIKDSIFELDKYPSRQNGFAQCSASPRPGGTADVCKFLHGSECSMSNLLELPIKDEDTMGLCESSGESCNAKILVSLVFWPNRQAEGIDKINWLASKPPRRILH